MRFNLKREIPSILLILAPYALLFYLWNKLPDQVPMHYNIAGEVDAWSDKSSLIWLVTGMMGLIYAIFLFIPIIDPRLKVEKMGKKYKTIKFWMILFFSLICCLIVYSSYEPKWMQTNILMMIIALLFAVLGNYFKTIPPNYFMGIKTPWTLENELVWKKTHNIGGRLWLIAGILLFLLGFVLESKIYTYLFVAVSLLLALIPIVYSYKYYRQIKKETS